MGCLGNLSCDVRRELAQMTSRPGGMRFGVNGWNIQNIRSSAGATEATGATDGTGAARYTRVWIYLGRRSTMDVVQCTVAIQPVGAA